MNSTDYTTTSKYLLGLAEQIETAKRPGYTRGDDDVLKNFKAVGERLKTPAETAWACYFLKHVDAILSIMLQPELPVSEEPSGRFADAINYLKLGYALYEERTQLNTPYKAGCNQYGVPENVHSAIQSGDFRYASQVEPFSPASVSANPGTAPPGRSRPGQT